MDSLNFKLLKDSILMRDFLSPFDLINEILKIHPDYGLPKDSLTLAHLKE